MRPIEDHHFAFGRRAQVRAPEKVVRGFLFARLLESEDEGPLRIHPAEHMPDGAVLAGRIERLQHHEKGLAAVRVKQVLQLVHALGVLLDLGERLLRSLVLADVGSIDFRQPNLRSRLDHKLLSIVHPGCSLYDVACSRSDWVTICMLLGFLAVRKAAKRSVSSLTPPSTNIQAML